MMRAIQQVAAYTESLPAEEQKHFQTKYAEFCKYEPSGDEMLYKIIIDNKHVGHCLLDGEYTIHQLVISDAHSRKGYGTEFVRYIENTMFLKGKKYHYLLSMSKSTKFWERLGYEVIVPIRRRHGDSDIVMVKKLEKFTKGKFVTLEADPAKTATLKLVRAMFGN